MSTNSSNKPSASAAARQHGVKGVYYGGDWLDIEDCDGVFNNLKNCSDCTNKDACSSAVKNIRSQSRNASIDGPEKETYDIVIIGAGCIGAAIARELSKYAGPDLKICWLESADDVSQGATKGNSGIVHAGYDDKPGTNHAKYCWKGNQMFSDLDKELRFGYQKNGSLVVATNRDELKTLHELKKRGETNGVEHLEIITDKKRLFDMEPYLNPNVIGALYSPDAGNVIPYEYAIALAENACDNGVELYIRRLVSSIDYSTDDGIFKINAKHWEPQDYIHAISSEKSSLTSQNVISALMSLVISFSIYQVLERKHNTDLEEGLIHENIALFIVAMIIFHLIISTILSKVMTNIVTKTTPLVELVKKAGIALGKGNAHKVNTADMLVGGSGSMNIMNGVLVKEETIKCKYVINCAGGYSDKIANMIGDTSFKVKPRIGDYILLNRNQGHLAKHTIFPCPHPVLGKGVLVQTTLWGNLILGPTARDMYTNEKAANMSASDIQTYILSKCKALVPSFDCKETIHAFNGARAKTDRGDWIIENSSVNSKFIHVAGIDSPGLAGSPAIALETLNLLKAAGLTNLQKNPNFNPNRAPIITPKVGMRGLKFGDVGKNDSSGSINTTKPLEEEDSEVIKKMSSNVICKCEKVTELEVVRAMRRILPIDSSQGIRKRTRAGMGHCQGDPDNYNCEGRVKAIIARENQIAINKVGSRPWPATSTLKERWLNEEAKEELQLYKDNPTNKIVEY